MAIRVGDVFSKSNDGVFVSDSASHTLKDIQRDNEYKLSSYSDNEQAVTK